MGEEKKRVIKIIHRETEHLLLPVS